MPAENPTFSLPAGKPVVLLCLLWIQVCRSETEVDKLLLWSPDSQASPFNLLSLWISTNQRALIFCLFSLLVFQDGEGSKITLLLISVMPTSLAPVNALSSPSMVPSVCPRICNHPLFQSHCVYIYYIYYLITSQVLIWLCVSLQMRKPIAPHIVTAFLLLCLLLQVILLIS